MLLLSSLSIVSSQIPFPAFLFPTSVSPELNMHVIGMTSSCYIRSTKVCSCLVLFQYNFHFQAKFTSLIQESLFIFVSRQPQKDLLCCFMAVLTTQLVLIQLLNSGKRLLMSFKRRITFLSLMLHTRYCCLDLYISCWSLRFKFQFWS